MMDIFKRIDAKKTGIFAAGVLFMKTITSIQENAEDIYAEATQINEERAAGEKEFEDAADTE